jgi:hypothetical protein
VPAFGSLLDGDENPVPSAPAQSPELAHARGLGQAAGALDVVSVLVLDVVAQLRLDAHHHAVGIGSAAAGQAHILDLGLAHRPHVVAPAAAGEVVEPSLPLHQELGADERAQPDPVAGVPCRLDLGKQPRGLGTHRVGREGRVVLGRLGGGELDLAPALRDAAPIRPARTGPRGPPRADARTKEVVADRDGDQPDHEDPHHPVGVEDEIEDRPEDQIEDEAVATPTASAVASEPAATASAEGRGAAAGPREGGGREDEDGEERQSESEGEAPAPAHALAASASGPAPGCSWAMC